MSETFKKIDPAALATLTTGIVLCDWGDAHEAAEWVMGHPIWTHHFILPEIKNGIRNRILAQFPDMPVVVGNEGWEKLRDGVHARYGNAVKVARGDGTPPPLMQGLEGKDVAIVASDEEPAHD